MVKTHHYLGILGDIQVGHNRALCHPNFLVKSGPHEDDRVPVSLNKGQRYLYQCWQHTCRVMPQLDALLVVGDMLQGHRDKWSSELTIADMDDQEDAVVDLLEPIVKKASKSYFCAGTKFHNADHADHELSIVKSLRKKGYAAKHALWWDLSIGNKIINAVHGHSTALHYMSQPLERESFYAALQEIMDWTFLKRELPFEAGGTRKFVTTDAIIRAHLHFFTTYASDSRKAVLTPCWQLLGPYQALRAASFFKKHWSLGALVLEITDEPIPDGIRTIRAPFAYPLPAFDRRVEKVC